MLVTLNGSDRDVPEGLSVQALVEYVGLNEGPVAVEINGAIIPRARHADHRLASGDIVEIVHFVGGG
jgi:sulfur carrier protein